MGVRTNSPLHHTLAQNAGDKMDHVIPDLDALNVETFDPPAGPSADRSDNP
jgi:hypothetical protein